MSKEQEFKKLMDEIDKKIDSNFVTATFGDNWKSYANETMTKEDLIRIAWRQGRKAILLERELEKYFP